VVSSSSIVAHSRSLHLPRRGLVILVLLCLALLALAGCGSSDNGVAGKPATEILATARTAARNATSVHVVVSAKILHGRPSGIDARLGEKQAQAHGSVLGASFNVIRDGETLYVKGNRQFNAGLEATMGVKVPSGVWLKGTTGSLKQLGVVTIVRDELPVTLNGSGPVTKGAKLKVDGQPAITLKQIGKLGTSTLYVATTGQPYPLKIVKTGEETGQTTFTGWNEPVTVSVPVSSVDISQLQHVKGH
jgi:hypothetical protein